MPFIQLASQAYEASVHGLPPEKCENLYAENLPTQPDKPFALIMTPGQDVFSTPGTGPIRGGFENDGVLLGQRFVVSFDEVYTVTADGTAALYGTLTAGTTRTPVAGNGVGQIVVVTDPEAWVIDNTGVTQITDPDFPGVKDVIFINGIFIFVRKDTGEVIWSQINDGTDYDALDFATAESSPDNLLGIKDDKLQVFLFGSKTIEFWTTTSDPDSPVVRRPAGSIKYGVVSRDAIVATDNTIYWVDPEHIVYRLAGADTPQVVSTPYLSELLETVSESEQDEIRLGTYVQRGHRFIMMDIPGQGVFAYDPGTTRWHARTTRNRALYSPLVYINLFGEPMVGDRLNSNLYILNPESYQDDTEDIERLATANVPSSNELRDGVPVDSFILDGIKGQGQPNAPGDNPKVGLRRSIDGGNSFTNQLIRKWGKIGEYGIPTIWRALGRFGSRGMIFEIQFSDPINVVITGARINDE